MVKSVKKTISKKPVSEKKPIVKKGPVSKTASKKVAPKKTTPKKKTASKKLEEGVDGEIEYEQLGRIDEWDWNEVNDADDFVTDELGGFLCLEEISDVEVEYEGDETVGKVATFKVSISLPGKKENILLIFFFS